MRRRKSPGTRQRVESRPPVDGPYDDPMFLEDMEAFATRMAPKLLEELIERRDELPGPRSRIGKARKRAAGTTIRAYRTSAHTMRRRPSPRRPGPE